MIRTFGSLISGWGFTYAGQVLSGRFRFPAPPAGGGPVHFILVMANHFEPMTNGWNHAEALRALGRWCKGVEALDVKDADGHPFRHTYFFPAEQYRRDFVGRLAEHCAPGFGEVELHLHHGLDGPESPASLEARLRVAVDRLVAHGCLAREKGTGRIGYSFVHGNWALANSAGGEACGVDNEMEILARTGCYMDCTLPSAPDRSQVRVINSIYACGRPLREPAPHRSSRHLRVGGPAPTLPLLLQGPLLVHWGRRIAGLPVPRLENGAVDAEYPPTIERFRRWASANIHVHGRPAWVFVKLHTHGLVERHLEMLVGPQMRAFLEELLRQYNDGTRYCLHFATAREAANMIFAAVAGRRGDPGHFRDFRYLPVGAEAV